MYCYKCNKNMLKGNDSIYRCRCGRKIKEEEVKCQECGRRMILRRGAVNVHYVCVICGQTWAIHQHDGYLISTPCDKETRFARRQLHLIFDQLWKHGGMSRNQAYKILAHMLDLKRSECHIGTFNKKQCQLGVRLMKEYIRNESQRGLSAKGTG